MHNWNLDEATERVEAISDPTARRLTRLFLDAAVLHAAKKSCRPCGEFDLAFFVTVVSQVTVNETVLLRRVLDGENIDAGWDAISEVLGTDPQPAMGR